VAAARQFCRRIYVKTIPDQGQKRVCEIFGCGSRAENLGKAFDASEMHTSVSFYASLPMIWSFLVLTPAKQLGSSTMMWLDT